MTPRKEVRYTVTETGEVMRVREPTINNFGVAADHDQCCAVFPREHAVLDCATEIFYPSRKAQAEGWRLVQGTTLTQRIVLRLFFGEPK